MSNIQIETDLKEILNKIDGKLDNLQKDVTDINVRFVKVETKLDSTVDNIKEIKGSQKAQIWSLIGVLITAVGGFVVAVGRSVLTFNN